MGTTGYCMGGVLAIRTAAAHPDRIGAAASFHAGGLVTDAQTDTAAYNSEADQRHWRNLLDLFGRRL